VVTSLHDVGEQHAIDDGAVVGQQIAHHFER
jgi:hypothetical protein